MVEKSVVGEIMRRAFESPRFLFYPHNARVRHRRQPSSVQIYAQAAPREVSPLRDHRSFDTVNEYKQNVAQLRKQQETLRDRQRYRSKRSRPKREREQAERREAAAAQK